MKIKPVEIKEEIKEIRGMPYLVVDDHIIIEDLVRAVNELIELANSKRLDCGCPRHDENSMCINQAHLARE